MDARDGRELGESKQIKWTLPKGVKKHTGKLDPAVLHMPDLITIQCRHANYEVTLT